MFVVGIGDWLGELFVVGCGGGGVGFGLGVGLCG